MDAIIRMLEVRRANAKARLDEFAAKFAKDPLRSLEWSLDVFEAAATYNVAGNAIAALGRDAPGVSGVRQRATENAMHGARWPRRSTSPTSNLAHACEVAALAELASDLEGL